MTRKLLLLGFVTCVAMSAAPNLVTNGSFSSGLSGWTTHTCATCEAAGWSTSSVPSDPGTPPPGATAAAITLCVGALCNDPAAGDDLSQTLTTVPGQTYTLSFYYDAGVNSGFDGDITDLQVYWNGSAVPVSSIENASASTWEVYSYNVVATGTSTVLEFTGRQDPATLYLTNVSVTAGGSVLTPPPSTPAPNTWVLLITGLAAVSIWAMRDRIREFLFNRG
jgi:hypothetical protein